MSMVIVGEKMPLALKLFDSNPNQKVRADVFSMFGDLLARVYLYHAQSGLYINTDLPMPDVPHVLVTYTVEESEDYESVCERIDSCQPDKLPDQFIAGQVESIVKSTEFITGVIHETTNN